MTSPVPADFELVQAPNPPQDHATEPNGHIQRETGVCGGAMLVDSASSVHQVNRQSGREDGSDSVNTDRDPSV